METSSSFDKRGAFCERSRIKKNLLFVDEAAIIENNIAEQFFTAVHPVISAGENTKMLVTSTPLGLNHFWKMWNDAEKNINGFVVFETHWSKVPGRTPEWAAEQKQVLGALKFRQEVECAFLGSSNTLIDGEVLTRLIAESPIWIDNTGNQMIYERPDKTKMYTIVVDVSRGTGFDHSVVSVFDVTDTPYKLVAKYRDNHTSYRLLPDIIYKLARDYNDAYVLIESNDIGGEVCSILYQDLAYENIYSTEVENGRTMISAGFGKQTNFGVKTNKPVKRIGCAAIKELIEENQLIVPDQEAIFEMSTFIEKAGSYQADQGKHDDVMMTLVLFGWLSGNQYFRDLNDVDLRRRLYEQQMAQVYDDLTPFGFIDRGEEPDHEVINGNVWHSDGYMPSGWMPDTGYR